MPSLSEKLKALGVHVGAQDLPAPSQANLHSIEKVLNGRTLENHQGKTFIVEEHYPWGAPHGQGAIKIDAPLDILARWAGHEQISTLPAESFAFIDTETTGLSGGSGTYAFLIGAGRFEGDNFYLAQFFMQDPAEEPAQLAALEDFLAPCQAIVSFNGKAFDIPLLTTRYAFQGWQSPFKELAHIDLLHLARRLWRNRLPSRTLGNLEVQILDASRSEEDVPGWMIPEMFFNYLRDGDARPLKNVFYHNAVDVVSLAALMNHMAALLSKPVENSQGISLDLLSLARLYEDLQDVDMATGLYLHGLDLADEHTEDLPVEILLDAIQRLALIYKRQGNFPAAIPLWEKATQYQHLSAYLELSKFYEHRSGEYATACNWCQQAIHALENAETIYQGRTNLTPYLRRHWMDEFEHRLDRLHRKMMNSDGS
jgi:uncharacterized protein YprB with RNaseH-like and TPR domain